MNKEVPFFLSNLCDPSYVQINDWSPIFEREGRELVSSFSLEEIKVAAFESGRSMFPGLGGFSVAFFQDN